MAVATLQIDGCGHAVNALLFDKDGTLFDFSSLWGGWADRLLEEVLHAVAPSAAHLRLGPLIGWDGASRRYDPVGPLAMGSIPDVLTALATGLYRHGVPWHRAKEAVVHARRHTDATFDWAAALRLTSGVMELLEQAGRAGLAVGVVTADDTATALAHLELAGLAGTIGAVVGDDMVTAGKPDPEPVAAVCRALGVQPAHSALFGDTAGDIRCGRLAGVGVMVGVAGTAELAAPLGDADHVVADFSAVRVHPVRGVEG
jgi:phosphoglycolate phosphatase